MTIEFDTHDGREQWRFDAKEREAFYYLCDQARGSTGPLPPDLLARFVLSVTGGADWPVQRAAMHGLLRRIGAGRREGLQVAERRGKSLTLGTFTLRRKRFDRSDDHRPYTTVLYAVDPPRGSCDCPDFLRSSLGLCKHLLAVLRYLYADPRKLWAARAAQASFADEPRPLRWDPIRPLTGLGDWLQRASWYPPLRSGRRGAASKVELRARQWFDSRGALRTGVAERPTRRLEIVEDLGAVLALATTRADPALAALLRQEQERLTRVFAVAPLAVEAASWQRGLKRRLYPFQIDGVRRFLQVGRLLLADDMGLGKTVQAVAACHALVCHRRARQGLVIVPASLKGQWLRQWQATTTVPATIVDGGPAKRVEQYRRHRSGFLIMNYEQLLRDLPLVLRLAPEVVVIDEAQRIKNWATKTAACVKALASPYRLALTGTPMENRLEELASIYDWIDDFALEPKWRLAPWHLVFEADGHHGQGGARHLDTLRTRLAGTMVRRVRQDVIAQLPPRTDTRVPVPLTAEQQSLHDELSRPIAQLVRMARRRPLSPSQFGRLMSLMASQRIICNGLAQLDFERVWPICSRVGRPERWLLGRLMSPKLFELRSLVRAMAVEQGRKVVVFSQWRRMLRLSRWALSDLLDDEGLRAVFFTGAESPKLRTKSIVEFHDDPSTRIMLLTDAGGVGLNLQRAASCCINLELPWNPAVLEQRIGRIFRLGQDRPIDVYNLVSAGGIEARIATIVAAKQALFAGLFDGTEDEVRFEVASTMIEHLEPLIDPDILADSEGALSGPAAPPRLPTGARYPLPTGVAPMA